MPGDARNRFVLAAACSEGDGLSEGKAGEASDAPDAPVDSQPLAAAANGQQPAKCILSGQARSVISNRDATVSDVNRDFYSSFCHGPTSRNRVSRILNVLPVHGQWVVVQPGCNKRQQSRTHELGCFARVNDSNHLWLHTSCVPLIASASSWSNRPASSTISSSSR